jgi:hypothetical protein
MKAGTDAVAPNAQRWISAIRLRTLLGTATLAIALALAGVPVVAAKGATLPLLVFGAIALLVTLLALLGIQRMMTIALFAFAIEFGTRLLTEGLAPAAALGYGVGLLAYCELLGFGDEFGRGERVERRVALRRLGWVGLAILLGAVASTLALLGGSVRLPDALLAVAIGVPAAVALIAAIYRFTTPSNSV